jgi:tetratricopeptide (TPR) repeat protein
MWIIRLIFSQGGEMLDSLDLAALRQQVEENKAELKRGQNWARNLTIVLGGLFLFAIFALLTGGRASLQFRLSSLYLLSCPIIFVVAGVGGSLYHSYRQNRIQRERLDKYAPDWVARPGFSLTLNLFVIFCLSAVGGLIGAALRIPYIAIFMIIFLPVLLPSLIFNWAKSGTHQQRLQRSALILRFVPNSTLFLDFRANVLGQAGLLKESGEIYRLLLSNKRHTNNLRFVSLFLNNLAGISLVIEDYNKVLPLLEASIHITPDFAGAYDTLAGYYLDEGIHPERALDLTDMAIEYSNKQIIESNMIHKATSARANALNGREARTNALLKEVFDNLKRLSPPAQAEAYRQAGYARRAQGNEIEAQSFFNKAVQLDPDGLFGKLALKALESTSSN